MILKKASLFFLQEEYFNAFKLEFTRLFISKSLMSNSSLEYPKKNKGKAKQYPRHKKERKFIWEQIVLHIHIPLYEYIYFYANEAFYYLEIQ